MSWKKKKKKDLDCEINDICLAFLLHLKEKYALKSGISDVCSSTPAFSSVCPPQLCLSQSFFFGFSLLGYEQSHDIKSKITSSWLTSAPLLSPLGDPQVLLITEMGAGPPPGWCPVPGRSYCSQVLCKRWDLGFGSAYKCINEDMLNRINEVTVQMPLEHRPPWGTKHLAQQPVPVSDHPKGEEMCPNAWSEPPLGQLCAVPSCP